MDEQTILATPVLPGRPYGLGRRPAPDDRDRRFLMRDTVLKHSARPRTAPYVLGPTLDQGDSPQCVGYSHRHKLDASPIMVPTGRGLSAFEIYKGAQQNDEWPGDDYDGTSVRGAQKFLQQQGYIKSYVWATTVREVHDFMVWSWGPTNWGIDWYDAMFTPDARGFVKPTGDIAGGHAILCFWSNVLDASGQPTTADKADPAKSELWFQNSWGPNWGIKLGRRPGCFKMTWADAETLLRADGECAAGIELKVA